MSQRTNLWFNKSRRAQNPDDYETWIEGGVVPTLNAFDNGDIRATTLVIPIHDKATRFAGKRKLSNGEYAMDGAGNGFGIGDEGDPMNTLTGNDRHAVALLMRMREGKPGGGKGPLISEDKSLTIATANDQTLLHQQQVRRLTPIECERLQGFPDNWTEGQSDTNRYKQMGNAVAVPVVEWIIQNICDIV